MDKKNLKKCFFLEIEIEFDLFAHLSKINFKILTG